MRRSIVSIIVAAMVLLSSGMVFAEDTKVTIGVKGWVNSWERTDAAGNSIESDDSILMIGPSLNLKFGGGFFLGATYLASTSDYEFSFPGGVDQIDRKDLDVVAGYMFNPMFGFFVGYKSISADVSEKMGAVTTDIGTFDLTGPGVGILGNIPLSDSVALYGSLSYMFMKYEEDFVGFSPYEEDSPGASIEIGIAAALGQNLSGSVGIKSQTFTGEDSNVEDKFSGLTFGLNYTF